MLIPILAQCLQTHKRLVVPGLGAFIVKEPGRCVVFTELLKRDDGVLRQTLIERGVDESEVAGIVDRFVAEVRHTVGEGGEVRLPGLGALLPGANGSVAFVFDPAADGAQLSGNDAAVAETKPREPYCAPSARPVQAPAAGASALKETSEPSAAPQREPNRTDKPAAPLRNVYEERPVSTSARMSPDPAVKGLRYSKPLKTTDAYTYVGQSSHRHHHHHHHHRRSRGWLVWLVALLAILVALFAIGYKPYSEWREQRELDKLLKQAGVTTNASLPEPAMPDNVVFSESESVEP